MIFLMNRRGRGSSMQIDSVRRAIERVAKIKERKIIDIKRKNQEKEEKSSIKKSTIARNDAKYSILFIDNGIFV